MKKYLILALISCALMSCGKEDMVNENSTPLSFTAGFDSNSKSMLNNDRSQTWIGLDQVTIYDVTDYASTSSYATFTNTRTTPSTSATFKIDSGFESFAFQKDHKYIAVHNANSISLNPTYYSIHFKNPVTYDSGRKYGMPDNTIPVACYFTYSDESSLHGISFHNISSLCVVRVTNNTSDPINITDIQLEAISTTSWAYKIFRALYIEGYKKDSYDMPAASPGSKKTYIVCNNTIPAGESCDYSTLMARIYDTNYGDLTLKVTVNDGSTTLAESTKKIHVNENDFPWHAGDIKVFNITVNPSYLISSATIVPYENHNVNF